MDKKVFLRPSKDAESEVSDTKTTFLTLDKIANLILQAKVITTKLKATYPEDKFAEVAEALDDITGSIDIAQHHIEDIKGMLFED